MTAIEFLNMVTEDARKYRHAGIAESIERNKHMHECRVPVSQEVAEAVLTDFINYMGRERGCDYGLYSPDLSVAPAVSG